MKLLAAKEWTFVYFSKGFKHRITATAELVHRDGNPLPYFSITGEIDYQAKNNRWVFVRGGAIHEHILEYFSQLKPLVDIHLSDQNGIPMHAYANASYWAGDTKYQPLDLITLARHLRISTDKASTMLDHIADKWADTEQHEHPTGTDKWQWACETYGLLDGWKQDAAKALSLLNILEVAS